ncbi:hypothetical protein [Cupriavidus pauculus]|uniref:hypothetical protein n=1 Tax=Cupriavidus pauculus TaxID=82633 RepID=UPI00078078B3|nr:hypothetical protein [Cupriavidus pauculus]
MSEKLDLDALERRIAACDLAAVDAYDAIGYLIARIRELERASQPGSGEALAQALAMYDSMRDHIGGCTDGGCVIKRPTGMRTNGGCKCATDKYKAQRMMYAGQKLADAARASLDGRREG